MLHHLPCRRTEIAGAPPLAAEVITFTQNGEVTDIVKWESNDGRAAIYEGDFFKVLLQAIPHWACD